MKDPKQQEPVKKVKARSGFLFEELEPRLLLSADLPVDISDDFSLQHESLTRSSLGELEVPDIRAQQTSAPGNPVSEVRRELVFVDSSTPDYQLLLDDLLGKQDETRRFEVILLDNKSGGIRQITEALGSADDLDAVHIVSHGTDGSINLGNDTLDYDALLANTKLIQAWSGAFTESGDLLIYGCNLAASEDGQSLVEALYRLTGADVAASDDLTGNAERGGDWELEYQVGTLESSAAFSAKLQQNYQGLLIGNISGVAYIDEGVTDIGAGKTISMLVNGVNVESVVTGAGGAYSFTSGVSAGDAVAVFIDNDASYKGVAVTVSDGTDLSGVQILADHIVIRNDNGGVTSNADLANALGGSPDPDIHYAVVGGTLIANGVADEVLIPTGHAYSPGGDVSASNIKILGTVNGGANTFSIAGDWNSTAGTWNAGTSSVNLIGTGTLGTAGNAFYNLTVGAASQVTTLTSNLAVTRVLTIADPTGALTDNGGGYDITVTGTGTPFVNNGATVTAKNFIYSYPTDATITAAGGTYNVTESLWIAGSGTGSGTTYRLSGDLLVTGEIHVYATSFGVSTLDTLSHSITADSLRISNGSFQVGFLYANNSIVDINGKVDFVNAVTSRIELGGSSWFVSGDWTNNSNTFNAGTSTVNFDGGTQNISGSTAFYNFTKIESTDDGMDSTLIFDNTATQTINGTLTLDGLDTDDRINLISNAPGNQWSINLTASAIKDTMDYLDVADSDASGSDASQKLVNPADTFNSGNNIDWFSNSAPTIGGTVGGQAVNDNATIQPFSSVLIGDNDVIETLTVTVTLDVAAKGIFSTLNGFTDTGGGVYTFSGTAAAATSAIQGLVFDPSDNRVAPGATETTTFSISVDDGIAAPATDATTTVVSTSINDAPVAVDDSYNVSEGGGGFLPPMGVLLNDSDIDSGSLTAIQLSNVTHGTLTLNANGSFWYTRDPDYYGVDSFTYKVNDGSLDSNVATVTFNIAPRNDAPTGSDTTVTTPEDTDYVFSGTDFGFSDPVEGDGLLAVRITTLPGAGTLTLVGSGAVSAGEFITRADLDANRLIFTPATDANGSAYSSFTFQVQDDGGTANGGMNLDPTPNTLTIDVSAVNDSPMTSGISNITVNEDTLVTFMNLQGSFADTEDAASALVYTITNNTNPSLFSAISLSSNGALNINYAADQNGSSDITVRVSDTGGSFVESTFTVTVNPVNDAPTVSGTASDTGFEDTVRVYTHAELLALIGAADVDDADAWLSISISNVVNGTVSLNGGTGGAGTTFAFTPTLNYVGNLGFDYQVGDDEAGTSAVGTATVALGAVNDAPVQNVPSAQSTAANNALIFSSLDGNSITVSDPDGAGTMLEVTLTASTGRISLADTAGLTFGVGSGSGDETMTFSGTANMINAALDGMYYQSDPAYAGAASLTIITGDLGNTGSGGALSTRDVVEISVSNGALLSAIDEMIDELVDFALEDSVDPYVPPTTAATASPTEASVDESPGTTGDAKNSLSETVPPEAVPVSIQDLRGNETDVTTSLGVLEVKSFGSPGSKPSASLLVQRAVQVALADPLVVATTLMQLQPGAPIWNIIDTMMGQMDDDGSHELLDQDLTVTTTTGLTLTLTAGYVSWLLRAGYISASLLSITPLWREFDPLPILKATAKKTHDCMETERAEAESESDINVMFPSSGLPGPARNGNGVTP